MAAAMEAHSLLDQEIPRSNGVPSAEKETPEQRINQWQLSASQFQAPTGDQGRGRMTDRLSKEINTIKPSTRPRWLQLRLEPHGPLLN